MPDIERVNKVKPTDEEDEAKLAGLIAMACGAFGATPDLNDPVTCYSGVDLVLHCCTQGTEGWVASVNSAFSNAVASRGFVVPSGTTMTDWTCGPPSAFPRELSRYVVQLQRVNQTLETRVEKELTEFRMYLPTIRKLTREYGSAASRGAVVLTRLGRKYDPPEAWKIAEKKDALPGPPGDEYSEIM